MASYSDIARLTGLSLGTISNVLTGNGNVKEVNKQKVLKAVEELNYRIDLQARALASDRTSLIGLVTSDLNSVAESQMMMPMINFARENRCRIIVATSNGNGELERESCETLLSSNVDGLFVFSEHVENIEYFQKLAKTEKTPIIMVSRYLNNCPLPFVAVDNAYAGRCMVEYVYGMGHREITYLDAKDKAMLSPHRDRREGVKKACEEFGVTFHVVSEPSQSDDVSLGYQIGEKLIRSNNLPPLVMARNDSVAVGFYNICTRYGISIPDDVSLMSFGNFYPPTMTARRLSSFDRRFDRVIEEGIKLYIHMRDNHLSAADLKDEERKIFVKGCIIEGETVRKL